MMKAHPSVVAALHPADDQNSNPVDQAAMAHWSYGHRSDIDPALLQTGNSLKS